MPTELDVSTSANVYNIDMTRIEKPKQMVIGQQNFMDCGQIFEFVVK